MRTIEYLYFNIYNHFYRRNYHSQDFHARIQVMYLCSLSAGGWILLLETVYLRMIKHSWFSSKPGATLFAAAVYTLTALIFNHIFINNEHDQKIFGRFEEGWRRNPSKRRDLLISVFVIIVPYLFLVSLAIFFPKHR